MKPWRRQVSIGSMMVVIAVVACVLAVPRKTWASVGWWGPDLMTLLLLGMAGLALGIAGGNAASKASIDLRVDRGEGASTDRSERSVGKAGRAASSRDEDRP